MKSAASSRESLQDLFRHIEYTNPFALDRVSELPTVTVDVELIHQRPFQTLVSLAEAACRERRGIGAVLWGEPGIGKSHLLARVNRWAKHQDRAYFLFLHNLQVSPERVPGYVLKCVISRLVDGHADSPRDTALYDLLHHAVKKAIRKFERTNRVTRDVARRSFFRLLDEFHTGSPADDDDRRTWGVLFEFFLAGFEAKSNVKAELATRWLRGDGLDGQEAARLSIAATDGGSPDTDGDRLTCLADNHAVERVLVALMQLAAFRQRPFILCFDQVENLREEQMSALSTFAHSLIDHAANLLLITSGVYQDLLDFKREGTIGGAAWDRMAEEEVRLLRISPTEGRQLLEARLGQYFEHFVTCRQVKEHVTNDAMFPLATSWYQKKTGDSIELTPRQIIQWARSRWREEIERLRVVGGPSWIASWPGSETPSKPSLSPPLEELVDEKVAARLAEQIQRRELDPSALPPDASNLCGLTNSLLEQCLNSRPDYTLTGLERPKPGGGRRPAYDLLVRERRPDGQEVTTGMCFVVTGSRTSTAASLRRIAHDSSPPDHILLVTDSRQPLLLGPRGREYYDRLVASPAHDLREFELSFRDYTRLDALQAIAGQACSGDLEVESGGEYVPVTMQQVIDSHHRRDRYRSEPLLRELLTEESLPAAQSQPTAQQDPAHLRRFIRERLELTLGSSSVELAKQYAESAGIEFQDAKAQIEAEAKVMFGEKLLQATPLEDHFYLLIHPAAL